MFCLPRLCVFFRFFGLTWNGTRDTSSILRLRIWRQDAQRWAAEGPQKAPKGADRAFSPILFHSFILYAIICDILRCYKVLLDLLCIYLDIFGTFRIYIYIYTHVKIEYEPLNHYGKFYAIVCDILIFYKVLLDIMAYIKFGYVWSI